MGEISLYIVASNPQFSATIKNILYSENKILFSGHSIDFINIASGFVSPESSKRIYPNILLIDDTNFDKAELLNFLLYSNNGFFSSSKRMVYTESIDAIYLRDIIKKDVRGILHKKESAPLKKPQKFIDTIEMVYKGVNCFDNIVTSLVRPLWARGNELICHEPKQKYNEAQKNGINSLSKREKEVFQLILQGYENKAIADKLFISSKTVSFHKENIKTKLSVNSVKDLYSFRPEN